ncbi:hypothetical protein PoB_003102200 [Plakobranchus ocellatus]|uniref:Uncharacterized protein n=1 Tax=Plakobranchus ocellatus TaxID=259542 RepID=A0AAV4ABV8_9GAST|nr:hypothetical protein PoB_003102200 [Plakobranchus ocellatus]
MGIPEDHIHHENQDDASIEGQAEQENHDLLLRLQHYREENYKRKKDRCVSAKPRFLETPQITLVKISSTPGIPQAKKTDLLSLCQSGQIPNSYRHFFDSLSVGAEVHEIKMED